MPLVINGNLIPSGFTVYFKNGAVQRLEDNSLNIQGENITPLVSTISSTLNMDKLGEVALVAGSPIRKTGRIFNSTLLDENAAPHIALGNGYRHPIKGLEQQKNKKKYLQGLGVNESANHVDFMIGGPHVQVFFEKAKAKDPICLIDNDIFLDETMN